MDTDTIPGVQVTATTTEVSWSALADALNHSLSRGDFDDDTDFEEIASRSLDKISVQWTTIDGNQPHSVTLPLADFDAVFGVFICDTDSNTILRPALVAINQAINAALDRHTTENK